MYPLSQAELVYLTMSESVCQQLFQRIFKFFLVRNGERGIWTLAPGLPTYTLSRGASSASWVFLLKFIFYDIHFTSSSTHRLLYLMDFSLSTCFLRFCYIFLYHSLAKLNSTPLWNLILQKLASLFYNKKNINLLSLHLDAILFLKNLHRLVTCAVRRTYIRKGLSLFKRLAFSYWRTILFSNCSFSWHCWPQSLPCSRDCRLLYGYRRWTRIPRPSDIPPGAGKR